MFAALKQRLKKIPLVAGAWSLGHRARLWGKDVSAALFPRSAKMETTPAGIRLIGSRSIHHRAMQRGTFEPAETLVLQELFRAADVFVDVGANIGYYSCLARLAGKHVVAVEPLTRNLNYLAANVLENGWNDIEIFPVGLGEKPGLATLYGGSSTGASLTAGWAGSARMLSRTIPLSTLDTLLGGRFGGKKILVKIDVEGAEYPVLLGAADAIRRQPRPTWVVEICLHDYHPQGVNENFLNTFELFWRNGYEAATADPRRLAIRRSDVERWVRDGRSGSGTNDYLFEPRREGELPPG